MGRPSNKPNATSAKKKRIAVERAKGATLKDIAAATGLSPKTIEKHVASREVKALMREFADRHDAELDESYRVAIETLTRLMQQDNAVVALEAVDRLIHLLGTTDKAMAPGKGQAQEQTAQQGTFTMAELTVSLERYIVATHPK